MIMKILFILALASVLVPFVIYRVTNKEKGVMCLMMNAVSFFSVMLVGVLYTLGAAVPAFAATTAESAMSVGEGLKFVGAALSTGLSGIGGGIAVASAASAAIGAMSENEKIMGKTLIFVALAEGIALYGLVISIMILGN